MSTTATQNNHVRFRSFFEFPRSSSVVIFSRLHVRQTLTRRSETSATLPPSWRLHTFNDLLEAWNTQHLAIEDRTREQKADIRGSPAGTTTERSKRQLLSSRKACILSSLGQDQDDCAVPHEMDAEMNESKTSKHQDLSAVATATENTALAQRRKIRELSSDGVTREGRSISIWTTHLSKQAGSPSFVDVSHVDGRK